MELLPELTAETFDAQLAYVETKYLPVWAKLAPGGVVLRESTDNHKWSKEYSSQRINKLKGEIPRYFQKHSPLGKKYWNTSSSYGQKHQLASEIEKTEKCGYSTNGEFIFAMMLLDYEMKPVVRDTHPRQRVCPNVTFNCSKRDLAKVLCDCGLQYSKNSKQQHLRSKTHETIMAHKHINDTDTEFGDYLEQAIDRLKKN